MKHYNIYNIIIIDETTENKGVGSTTQWPLQSLTHDMLQLWIRGPGLALGSLAMTCSLHQSWSSWKHESSAHQKIELGAGQAEINHFLIGTYPDAGVLSHSHFQELIGAFDEIWTVMEPWRLVDWAAWFCLLRLDRPQPQDSMISMVLR